MPNTEQYRARHAELSEVVSAISERLDPQSLDNGGATDVCMLMGRLVGILSVHMSAVDDVLSPAMIGSSDREAADAAERFRAETASLKSSIENYFLDWGSPATVMNDPQGFRSETESIFTALGNRIACESAELYPLAERI
jgi:hypothetical protein